MTVRDKSFLFSVFQDGATDSIKLNHSALVHHLNGIVLREELSWHLTFLKCTSFEQSFNARLVLLEEVVDV